MMSVWSRRPHFLHLGLFIAAYVLGCGFAQALAIVPGTGISIWPPSGLFMATLILASRHSWPWWVLGGCLAELFSNALWFHNPLSVALLIYTGNVLEAVAGAWLVTWACRRPFRLETLQEVLTLVVLGAGIAPVASATVGSATLAWFGMQTFAAAWPLFWLGDATGVLIVAPLALAVLQNCGGRTQLSAARWMEACVLGLIFLGVAALSLSGHLPSAYIVMPPLLWAAVRFEFKGAAVALTLLALITVVFTISGTSQFVGDPEFQKQMQFALQLFLAISAFSVLTVAAVSRQHQQALLTLRDSERELSQLVDMVPSHVWRLTPDGEPTFFNKRMIDFLGLDVADLDKRGMSRLEAVIETVHPDEAIGFGDALRRSLATGENFALRYRLRRADGVYHWMSSRAEPMRDQNGRIVQWYGLCHDIDDQMHAEEALRRSERELQQLVDALPVHVWSWTPDGKLAYVNKRSLEELGLSGANVEDSTMVAQKLVHPEDAPEVLRTSANCLKAGDAFMMRYRRRCKDGSYRWMEGRCEPLRDQDGTIVHWYQVSIDIDDQMHAEEALRRSERQLQQMIDAVPVRIWSVRPTGGPIYFNKRYQDHFRAVIPNFDALGEPRIETLLQELIHPEDASEVQCTLRNCFDTGGGSAMRFRWREKDGAYRWAECRVEPRRDQDGVIAEWYGVSLDIDHEVRAQEALRERERELSLLVNVVPSHVWRLTPEGEPTFFNKRLFDFLGLNDLAQLDKPGMSRMAASIEALVHPEDATRLMETLRHSLATGEPYAMKYRIRRADGAYRWVDGRGEPLRDHSGAIVHWYAVSIDIDDQMRAQESLRDRERELSLLVEMVPSHLWRVSPEGETTFANKHMADYFGLDVEDKPRMEEVFNTMFHPDEVDEVWDVFARCLRTGEPFSMTYRLRRHDGVYRWMSGRAEPMRDESGRIVQWFGLCHDIDNQVRAEEALRRASERLARATQAASLAELSASIGHEVNQPLAAIVANSQACHRWLSAEPPNVERAKITAERITRDANSAADVVSRIRALFRQTTNARSSENINRVISEVCRLMADEIAAKDIRVETNLEPDLPPVALDCVQVQQVLVNLIRNGIEAMEAVVEGARALQIRSSRDDLHAIRVEVRDTGTGFKDADRVFEPFFTTKQHGMGMGLAICRSIIESHGGSLWTANEEARGATVAFTLPLATNGGSATMS